jgi:hypothetical protein
MIDAADVIRIAQELYSEGYSHSEAYPIVRWKRLGYPEDPKFFRAVDAYINFLKVLESK